MAEAVNRSGFVVGGFYLLIIIALVGEIPFLNFVYCHAADAHGAGFAQNGNGAFQVFRIGAHGYRHRAQRAVAPADIHHAGVFCFDVAMGGNHGLHILHRAYQPFHQVDIVAGLVHECTAVKFPSAAPAVALIVISLRACPEYIQVHHADFAEALFGNRAFEQLQSGVEAVLFHHKQALAGFVGGFHHAFAIVQAGGHRLFGDHMKAGLECLHRLLGVLARRRGEHDNIGIGVGQHVGIGSIAFGTGALDGRLQVGRVGVAHADDFAFVCEGFKRAEMVVGNAPAANQREFDFTVFDGFKHSDGLLIRL